MHRRPTRTLTALALAGLLATGLAACGQDDGDRAPGSGTPTESPEESPSPTDDATDDATDDGTEAPRDAGAGTVQELGAAIDAAEGEAGGTAYQVDREDRGWEVDVAVDGRSTEVRVGPDGAVVGTEDDDLDDDDRRALDAARITLHEAVQAAVAQVPGDVTDVELDREDGTHVWEVSLEDGGDEVDVDVDVTDGSVVGTDRDD